MMLDILLIINLVVLLYVWFETDAVPEWGAFLRIRFLKCKEYNEVKNSPLAAMAGKSYSDFLLFKYGKYFFIRLITCPVCFSVWCNLILYGVFYNKMNAIMVGPNILITWLLYHALKWVMIKLNA